MADKAISDRGKAGGAAKPAGTPNGTKATQSTNAVTGRAGQPPKGAPSSPPPVGAAAVKAVTQGAQLKGNVALGGSAKPGAPGGKPLPSVPSVPSRPSASPAAANGPGVRGAAAGGPGDRRPHGEATPAGASGKPADPGVKVKQVAQAANEINQALQQVGADEAREAVADSQKNLAQGILDSVRKGLTGHANDGQRNQHDTRERLEQLHGKVLSGAITAEQARQGLNETMRGYGAEAQRVNAGRVQALEVGASAVEATRNAAETTATMTATTLAGPVGGTVVGTFVRDLNKAAYELSAEAHDVPAPRQSLMRYGVDVVRGQKLDAQTRQQVLQSFGQSVVSSAVDAAVGRYSTSRTAGLMQSGTGAMRAAAVAQTEAQLLFRGSQAVGQAALEAAQDPDMTLRQKAEHVGQAALSQVASLPFTYLGAGLGIGLDSGQTLTSAGRQMLGDAVTGLADQATSTWLLEGRGLKGSEIAGTLTGSAVGGLNNFSQHPRTGPAAAAGADSHQQHQPHQSHQSHQSRQSHLPDLTGIDPQRQGRHIVDAMDSAIARHDQTGDPSDLNAVLGWANANAGAGSRKQWDRSHLQDYVRLGAEINRRIANPAAPAGQATPPAADGAPGVGGLSATPSSVVRAERELQQRERLQPVRAEIDRTGQANSAAPDAHTEPASRTQHAPPTAQPPAQPPAPEASTAANHDPLLDIVRGQLAAPELRQLIELSNQDLASEHARRARDELAENAVVAMAVDGGRSDEVVPDRLPRLERSAELLAQRMADAAPGLREIGRLRAELQRLRQSVSADPEQAGVLAQQIRGHELQVARSGVKDVGRLRTQLARTLEGLLYERQKLAWRTDDVLKRQRASVGGLRSEVAFDQALQRALRGEDPQLVSANLEDDQRLRLQGALADAAAFIRDAGWTRVGGPQPDNPAAEQTPPEVQDRERRLRQAEERLSTLEGNVQAQARWLDERVDSLLELWRPIGKATGLAQPLPRVPSGTTLFGAGKHLSLSIDVGARYGVRLATLLGAAHVGMSGALWGSNMAPEWRKAALPPGQGAAELQRIRKSTEYVHTAYEGATWNANGDLWLVDRPEAKGIDTVEGGLRKRADGSYFFEPSDQRGYAFRRIPDEAYVRLRSDVTAKGGRIIGPDGKPIEYDAQKDRLIAWETIQYNGKKIDFPVRIERPYRTGPKVEYFYRT
ncbi:MAG: hypothetical protein ACK5Y0_17235, partial [Pseudomonadota bacterium]